MANLFVKSGDTVKVLSGEDKGKTGKVQKAFPETGKVIVEGVAMVKKHQKPRGQGMPAGAPGPEGQRPDLHAQGPDAQRMAAIRGQGLHGAGGAEAQGAEDDAQRAAGQQGRAAGEPPGAR